MEHNIGQKAGDRRDQVSFVAVGGVSAAVGNFSADKGHYKFKDKGKGCGGNKHRVQKIEEK